MPSLIYQTRSNRHSTATGALLSSMFLASCMAGNGGASLTEEGEVRDVGANTSALRGEISRCERFDLLRWEVPYRVGSHENMQIASATLPTEQAEWWNRTDCAALIVDWVHDPPDTVETFHDEGGFMSALTRTDGDPEICKQVWTAKRFLAHLKSSPYADWEPVLDQEQEGCGSSPVWFGGNSEDAPDSLFWFGNMTPIRAIVQGWVSMFPGPVEAYIQTERSEGPCPQGPECCWDGEALTDCF